MKKILLTLGVILTMGLCAGAQTVTEEPDIESDENVQLSIITPAEPVQETEQEIKEREKRLREHNDQVAFAKASNSLRRGYFVLTADNIQIGNMGYRHYDIRDNYNFVLVQGEDGIIQYALTASGPGSNGLGGWTGKGKVRNKHLSYGKNGDVHFSYQLISGSVNADVSITLFHDSKRAMAYISGGVPITIYGEILPYRDKDHR
ncbi:MAG: DUF4251 domain-containing protein [Muribaculaceae bacterium]|nr:DUF4251 domain-containing protein [Muribaculaceae bacterium]